MPMPDEAEVTLNGLVLNGPPDSNGVQITCASITGWGPAATTGGVQQRSGRHGGSNPRQYYAPLILTLAGMVRAPSRALRELAVDDLNNRLDLALFDLVVTETIPKLVRARVNREVTWDDDTDVLYRYQAEVICPDPFKYGTTLQSLTLGLPASSGGLRVPIRAPIQVTGTTVSGDGLASNAGNFAAVPLVRIDGPVTNPVITNLTLGRSVSYLDTLAAGEYVLIDMGNWAALLNGTSSRSGRLSGTPWAIQPGANTLSFRASSGTGATALFQWRDCYR